jgi:hypothetical protein
MGKVENGGPVDIINAKTLSALLLVLKTGKKKVQAGGVKIDQKSRSIPS